MFIQFEVKYHLSFGGGLTVSANFVMQAEVTKFLEIMLVKPYHPDFLPPSTQFPASIWRRNYEQDISKSACH